jgi:protein tyrosine phosphatase type 4A
MTDSGDAIVAPRTATKAVPRLLQQPSLIEYKGAKFLITDAPTDNNLPAYIQEFKKHDVKTIVRTCDPSYSSATVAKEGINVIELPFPDGAGPPDNVVAQWLAIVRKTFKNNDNPHAIAVHCVAGLGRAPVLVAIALIELGMPPLDSITYIRDRRAKALNVKQINYLENYKRKNKKSCVVM